MFNADKHGVIVTGTLSFALTLLLPLFAPFCFGGCMWFWLPFSPLFYLFSYLSTGSIILSILPIFYYLISFFIPLFLHRHIFNFSPVKKWFMTITIIILLSYLLPLILLYNVPDIGGPDSGSSRLKLEIREYFSMVFIKPEIEIGMTKEEFLQKFPGATKGDASSGILLEDGNWISPGNDCLAVIETTACFSKDKLFFIQTAEDVEFTDDYLAIRNTFKSPTKETCDNITQLPWDA